MNAAEAWGIGVAILASICFVAGFFASRANRLRAEREDAEREMRKREVREWRERQR